MLSIRLVRSFGRLGLRILDDRSRTGLDRLRIEKSPLRFAFLEDVAELTFLDRASYKRSTPLSLLSDLMQLVYDCFGAFGRAGWRSKGW